MSILLSDELRLLYTIVLNALVFLSAWRFARRRTADRLQAVADALLLYYLVQYLAVGLPGLATILGPRSIVGTALLLCAALWFLATRRAARPPVPLPRIDFLFVSACALFVIGYLCALIYHQRDAPVSSNDALTYHLPAAVHWLQTGRLSLYEAWFYNPANSYSPLAGSMFIAWLIAPVNNDVIARFVQAPPLLFIFVLLTNLCRALGARASVGALIATAAVLSRPFVSQTILAKDDLFVVAFFLAVVVAASRHRLGERFSPWRIAIALGLMLATKYTALFALPILILLLDAPWRVGWHARYYGAATLLVIALAGPWFARNWVFTGNPLHPTEFALGGWTIWRGMLTVRRSHLLATPRGVWDVFTSGYYSLPLLLDNRHLPWIRGLLSMNGLLILSWIVAVLLNLRRIAHDPLRRAVLIGPPFAILLFAIASPYGEMRFVYPSIILLFATIALAVRPLPWLAQVIITTILALTSAATAFHREMSLQFILTGIILAILATLVLILRSRRWLPPIVWPAAATVGVLALATYVYWHAYVERYRHAGTYDVWSDSSLYPGQAEIWKHVREELPKGSRIAYANTYLVYPLTGFNFDHPLTYVPTRKNLGSFLELPRMNQPITGEEIPAHIVRLLRQDPDRDHWLERLDKSRADYLVVFTIDPAKPSERITPPEQQFAESHPARFTRVFPAQPTAEIPGTIYRINR